jgi:hypothetical protein
VLGGIVAPVPPIGADAEYKSALGKAVEVDGTPVPKSVKLVGVDKLLAVVPNSALNPVGVEEDKEY